MPRPLIADLRGQTDFQKTYFWELSTLRPSAFFNMADVTLNMLCTTTEVPKYSGTTAEVMFKGVKVLDPGIYVPDGEITLTFIEMVDSRIRTEWDLWILAMDQKPDLTVPMTADFKLITMDNQEAGNYEYNMLWCFPDTTTPDELGSDSSDPMKFSVKLRYSDVTVTATAGG